MKKVACHISKQRVLQTPSRQLTDAPKVSLGETQDGIAQYTGPRELKCMSKV